MLATLNRNLLKSVMLADGLVSLAAAAGLFVLSGPLAAFAGPAATPAVFTGLAAFFLLWGLFHLAAGRAAHPAPSAVRLAIAGDALWIAGSVAIVLLAGSGLTVPAKIAITVVAVAVADILLMKMIGLGRQQRLAV